MSLDEIYEENCRGPSDIHVLLPTLYAYARKISHVTEFGVRSGCSTSAFLAARPKRFVAYDLFRSHEVDLLMEAAETPFVFHQANVLEVDIEPTDLLFIDTDHTFDQLDAELRRHASQVSHYIIMHDTVGFDTYDVYSGKEGLGRAWREFLQRESSWSIDFHDERSSGLTVLAKKG
jgi:cephalosporin hydroxylase